MSGYERRIQFERWCAMRDAYRAAPAEERRSVLSVQGAIQLAETELDDTGSGDAGTSPATTASDLHDG